MDEELKQAAKEPVDWHPTDQLGLLEPGHPNAGQWADIQPHHHASHPFEFIFRAGLKTCAESDLLRAMDLILEELSSRRERGSHREG